MPDGRFELDRDFAKFETQTTTGSVKCRRLNLNPSVCELASPRLAAIRTEMQLLRRESDRFGRARKQPCRPASKRRLSDWNFPLLILALRCPKKHPPKRGIGWSDTADRSAP